MSDGLTKNRESYFDDSSAAIGLSHAAAAKARGGDPVAHFAGGIQRKDVADRELIAANETADREKRVGALMRSRPGWTRSQAEEFVAKEAAVPKGKRPRMSAEERRTRETEQLMDVGKKPAKHSGSKSGRRRTGKAGTWICRECHLEFCEHRPVRSAGPGRRATVNRPIHVTGRKSAKTSATLAAEKLSTSDALEVVAIALETARPFRDVLADFRARKSAASQPAA